MPEYINPGEGRVRVASTSGHVVFIGADKPTKIQENMEAEAKAKGCLPMSTFKALEERITKQLAGEKSPDGSTIEPSEAATSPPVSTSILTENEKLKKVVEAMELMLDADAGENYFTGQGQPRAAAVEELAGFAVNKELREQAWDIVCMDDKK